MGTTTELPPASPPPPVTAPGTAGPGTAGPGTAGTGTASPQRTTLQPPDEITRSLFVRGRRVARAPRLALAALPAAVLRAVCTVWLVQSPFASLRAGWVQVAVAARMAYH